MKSIILFLALSLLLIGNSYISTNRVIVQKMANSGLPFDAEWHQTLEESKETMKEAWLSWFKDSEESVSSLNEDFSLNLKESDLKKLQGIPVEIYEIDSASFSAWNSSIPIEQMLTLNKSEAELYLTKDNNFLLHLNLRYQNNTWNWKQVIGLTETARKAYSSIYFEKKRPLMLINIKINTLANGSKMECLVFIKDGSYFVAFDEKPLEKYFAELKASRAYW